MAAKKLARLCGQLADNRKAEDIVILDVRPLTTIADYFVIVTGSSEPHLRAVVEEISDKLRSEHHITPHAIDGNFQAAWIVLDYVDVIVHVMQAEVRARYDLEGLWGDAARLRVPHRAGARSSTG